MATVRVGQAESAGVEADLSSGAVPIAVVLKADGGTVHGTGEKCESGLVVLVAQDPALQTRGFLRDVRCQRPVRDYGGASGWLLRAGVCG
jgi:hypothetical protein